jgi:hypothetical protein
MLRLLEVRAPGHDEAQFLLVGRLHDVFPSQAASLTLTVVAQVVLDDDELYVVNCDTCLATLPEGGVASCHGMLLYRPARPVRPMTQRPPVLSGCPWLSSRMWSTPLMLPSLPATIGFREPTADRSVVVVFSVPSLGPLQQLSFVMVRYSKIDAAAGVSPDGRV